MKRNGFAVLVAAAFVVLGGIGMFGAVDGTNATAVQRENGTGRSRCSVMALKGTYAATLSGWVTTAADRVPYAEVAHIRLDGKGGLTGTSTFSIDGVVGTRSLAGTYTVDRELCAGEAFTGIGNFFFVVADNVNQTRFIGTSPGVTATGEAVRQ
jgi:hypothetical protein